MNNFGYTRASDVADAVRQIAADPAAKFIAGGTNLIDLMKENVARPSRLIDITHLPLNKIEETQDGGLRIGALVPNSDLAYHPQIEARYPLLAQRDPRRRLAAIAQHGLDRGQSAATNALLLFLRHDHAVQQARAGQRLLGDRGASTAMHAILGTSEHCIATHPSDMCVALAALEARVLATGKGGERSIAFADFHRLPGDTPQIDTNLRPDEIITAIELPPKGFAGQLQLSEDPRSPVLCVRPGIDRGRPRYRGRHDQGGAPRARRSRAQAVARPRSRSAAQRRAGNARDASCARPRPCCEMPAASATTTSRSSWRGAAFCVR